MKRKLFKRQYNVVVAGAGVAGVAAALEVARAGLKVALVEKTVFSGGLATTGLVYFYLPLCDGEGHQVSYGIAEELLHASYRYGPGKVPSNWRQSTRQHPKGRMMATFSPASFILALDELLTQAGVEIWYDTLICESVVRQGRIRGVEVENKSGRGVLQAPVVIDATGDGDVAFRAGCEFVEDGNKTTLWALQASLATADKAVKQKDGTALLNSYRIGLEGEVIQAELKRKTNPWRGTDGHSVSSFIVEGRRHLREHYAAMQQKGHRRGDLFPLTLPSMAQFRTTRAIVCRSTLVDGMAGKEVKDSIALAADWRKRASVWEIPYGSLVPKVTGLLMAGRCISSVGDAWEVTRVIPPAAQTGQVAGLAATMAIRGRTTPDRLRVKAIQSALLAKGMPYHMGQIVGREK